MSVFPQLRKVKKKKQKKIFFTFLETTTTYVKQSPMSERYLEHLCLSGMLGIIQSKIT